MFRDTGIIKKAVRYIKNSVDFFMVSGQDLLGIYIGGNDVFCVQVRCVDNNEYHVMYSEHIIADFKNEAEREEAIEVLENSLNKAGIFERRAIIYVDDCDVYSYSRNLDELSDSKLSEAVHWDLEVHEPFAGDYIEGYSVSGNRVSISAVCHQDMVEYVNCFKAADIDIYMAVTVNNDIEYKIYNDNIIIDNIVINIPNNIDCRDVVSNGINAIYAAVLTQVDLAGSVKFMLADKKLLDWRWDRISACILCVTCIISFILVGISEYEKYEIDNAIIEQKESLYLLADVLESKQRTDIISTEIEKRASLLKDLSKDSWPIYAILVHLGCINCDGVWLTDLSTDKATGISLKGEAVSYNSLVKYYQKLEEDRDFFTGEAVLEKSDLLENGRIGFQIRADLK